jgi:hypothetical protein
MLTNDEQRKWKIEIETVMMIWYYANDPTSARGY